MLEDAVAESCLLTYGCRPRQRQRRGDQKRPLSSSRRYRAPRSNRSQGSLFQGVSGTRAHSRSRCRPGRFPKLNAFRSPGFAKTRSPTCRRRFPCAVVITYSRPSGVNLQPVEEGFRSRGGDSDAAGVSSRRVLAGRRSGTGTSATRRRWIWSPQRPPAVGEDRASDRSGTESGPPRYLLAEPQERCRRPFRELGFQARGDQPQNLLLEQLPVTGVILVPDQPSPPPPFNRQ